MPRTRLRPQPGPPSPATQSATAESPPAQVSPAQIPLANIASEAGAPEPHGFAAGGGLRCHCPGLVGLWRRELSPVGRRSSFNAIIAAGKSNACRAARAIHRSGGRGGDRAHHRQHRRKQRHRRQHPWPRPDRAARCHAAGRRSATHAAAPPDQTQLLQKIARDLATLERNIEQLKANQQQMASDNSKAIGELKASQEEMKRDAREGFRADPAQGGSRLPRSRLRSCAGPSGRISRRRRERGLDITRERVDTTTIGSRRCGDRSKSCPAITPDAIQSASAPSGIPSRRSAAQNRAAPGHPLLASLPLPPHPTCQFREAGAACSYG